jgi:hypothetical protein
MSTIEGGGGPNESGENSDPVAEAIAATKKIGDELTKMAGDIQIQSESEKSDVAVFVRMFTRLGELHNKIPELVKILTEARDRIYEEKENLNQVSVKRITGNRVAIIERRILDLDEYETDVRDFWQFAAARAVDAEILLPRDKVNYARAIAGHVEDSLKFFRTIFAEFLVKYPPGKILDPNDSEIIRKSLAHMIPQAEKGMRLCREAMFTAVNEVDLDIHKEAASLRERISVLRKELDNLREDAIEEGFVPEHDH